MKGKCPLFGIIEKKPKCLQKNAKKPKDPIFNSKGGITLESVGNRAQFFLGKSAARLENELRKYGYVTKRRPSSHSGSKAKMIETLNSNANRNITMIQVSPGSKRHGKDVAYVKISTNNIGRIKVVNAFESEGKYITDGSEKANIFFRRK